MKNFWRFLDFVALCGMATVIAFGFVILLGLAMAHAQDEMPTVGKGLICDTSEQIEKVVALAPAKGFAAAVEEVNGDTKPLPCAVAAVAYVGREDGKIVRFNNDHFTISKITVVGALMGGAVLNMPPTVQYTVFPAKGYGI